MSGTEPTFANGILRMTRYTFRIRQGSHASDVHVNLSDDDAAWDEAAAACSDMIRDTTDRLREPAPNGG
jgi:hypothetical protein